MIANALGVCVLNIKLAILNPNFFLNNGQFGAKNHCCTVYHCHLMIFFEFCLFADLVWRVVYEEKGLELDVCCVWSVVFEFHTLLPPLRFKFWIQNLNFEL